MGGGYRARLCRAAVVMSAAGGEPLLTHIQGTRSITQFEQRPPMSSTT